MGSGSLSNVLSIWGGRRLKKEEIESLLQEAKIARFCCHNDDGTIHATPVWFNYENGNIIILTPSRSQKARNIKRNKNVTILVDMVKPPRGVMIYGTAELDNCDVILKAISITEKYVPKEKAKGLVEEVVNKGMDLIIKVKPDRMASFLTH
jgi:nitroimidazol reductase NimA-like FMN-containing flavoprotein (pyridoxamine 5'-phosphate oxidase superfamily)